MPLLLGCQLGLEPFALRLLQVNIGEGLTSGPLPLSKVFLDCRPSLGLHCARRRRGSKPVRGRELETRSRKGQVQLNASDRKMWVRGLGVCFWGTFRTRSDVRLESGMRSKADVKSNLKAALLQYP